MSGYYLDLPKIGSARLTRKTYTDWNRPILTRGKECVPMKLAYHSPQLQQKIDPHFKRGGNTSGLLQPLFSMMSEMTKTQLMAVIALLILEGGVSKKKGQRGGNVGMMTLSPEVILSGVKGTLGEMSRNLLVLIGTLLLVAWTRKGGKKMRGGTKEFMEKIDNVMNGRHNREKIEKVANDVGERVEEEEDSVMTKIQRMADNLGKMFTGGGVGSAGNNSKMIADGVKEIVNLGMDTDGKKNGKKKGGNCNGCGRGDNAYEVVGDKALNYNKYLGQFGCKIPEWGYDLRGCI